MTIIMIILADSLAIKIFAQAGWAKNNTHSCRPA